MYSQNLRDKVKRTLETVTSHPYETEERAPGVYLCLSEGLREGDPDVVLSPNGILEVGNDTPAGSMSKVADLHYHIHMYQEDCNLTMRKDNLGARRMLTRLASGVMKDFEMGEKSAEESSLKCLNDPNLIEVDYSRMHFSSKFSIVEMNEDEAIRQLEKRARAVSEASMGFLRWLESKERKRLYDRTSMKRESKSRTFLPYWPPNYGDQKRNEKETKEVIEFVRKYNAEFFTPHGKLELQNGKPVIEEEENPRGNRPR